MPYTHIIFCTFRCDVWITESIVNDFLGFCIFGFQNVNGVFEFSELRVLKKENNMCVTLAIGLKQDSPKLRIVECLKAFTMTVESC